eukprot:gnl/MRDRNA2_/MRDRNA2_185187_c0_seq1.p1 gnl/MRDRNA2_/MRDRNA2_185187_c0~~gnl/MRDRNA2_/MRDRNA2_185187_c0_seq1.p1  ORF type:complete len:269 (-),score=66.16 gnl/MRDRNA2_/MRDRNA2_185187_c0_seq1:160-966(-)
MTLPPCIVLFAISAFMMHRCEGADSDDVFCDRKDLVNKSVSRCTGIKVIMEKLEESDVQQVIQAMGSDKFNLLVLRNVHISEQQSEEIMNALAKNPNMEYLAFRENPLSLKAATSLFSAVKNGKFKEIDLRSTKLGDHEAALLADSLVANKELRKLDIDNCGLSSKAVTSIAAALKSLVSLETLYIAYNPMGDDGAIAIADAIKTMPKDAALSEVFIRDKSIAHSGRQALRKADMYAKADIYDNRREKIRRSWAEEPDGDAKIATEEL